MLRHQHFPLILSSILLEPITLSYLNLHQEYDGKVRRKGADKLAKIGLSSSNPPPSQSTCMHWPNLCLNPEQYDEWEGLFFPTPEYALLSWLLQLLHWEALPLENESGFASGLWWRIDFQIPVISQIHLHILSVIWMHHCIDIVPITSVLFLYLLANLFSWYYYSWWDVVHNVNWFYKISRFFFK